MRTIEQAIETASENLPIGWRIRVDVERGSAIVAAIRPDGTDVSVYEDETSLSDMILSAMRLAFGETKTSKDG